MPKLRPGRGSSRSRLRRRRRFTASCLVGGPTAAVPAEAESSSSSTVRDRGQGGTPSPFSDRTWFLRRPLPVGNPRVIPIEPLPGQPRATPTAARPKVIQLRRDSTGLVPGRPPGPPPRRSNDEVAKDVSNLIELIKEPEAEIAVVVGESQDHPDPDER